MNIDDFLDLLKKHDWYYNYSDDHKVWLKGKDERAVIEKAIKKDAKLRHVYQAYIQETGIV